VFLRYSKDESWKQRPDEEGIATKNKGLLCGFNKLGFTVRNIDLINKGLRLFPGRICIYYLIFVGNIDLMKKGLKALLGTEQERITLGVLL